MQFKTQLDVTELLYSYQCTANCNHDFYDVINENFQPIVALINTENQRSPLTDFLRKECMLFYSK